MSDSSCSSNGEEENGGHDAVIPSTDLLFELLADRRRRHILQCLTDQPDGVAEFTDLVDAVVGHESETDAGDRETVRTSLYHVHLPKLAEAGVIDYDMRSEAVRYSEQPLLEECLANIPHGQYDGD